MTQPANKRLVTEATVDALAAGKINDETSDTRTALNATYGTVIYPLSKGAVGDGVANDSAALAATMTAASTGTIVDLGGRTYKVGSVLSINKSVQIRNGSIISDVDRVAVVSAANVVLDKVKFIRTGPRTANSGALTLNAAAATLIDVTATTTIGEGLRMGNGNCNGTVIRGGYFATSDPNESFGIQLVSGPAHNYDIKVEGATIRNTGYGTGIGFYNCSRCTLSKNDIRGIRRSPLMTLTGWTLVSGTVYKTLDRTDTQTNALYVNGTEYRKDANETTTTPGATLYTVPGDGYLYLNTGVDPSTQTVQSTRTNGYGALMYATTSEAMGMSDNLISHNYIEDTDGFGIYYQTLENIPKNNRTLQNTLRNVCLTGVTVGDLPFAGIGVFGGLDVQLDGDIIDGAGSVGTPAPGVSFKASVGVPHMTASLRGVTVKNGKGNGIRFAPGTWRCTGLNILDNAGEGITNGTVITGDILDIELAGCVIMRNGSNGVYLETTSTGEIRPRILGGKYTDNTVRNITLGRCRDVYIGGGLISSGAGTAGINLTSTNQRVVLDGVFLRSGLGITVQAGITDLTITNIVNDGSSGTKLNVNSSPYKVGGTTGFGTQWRCTGTPEGQITAAIGSMAVRTDGGAGTTFYVKESGTGNTGWIAK